MCTEEVKAGQRGQRLAPALSSCYVSSCAQFVLLAAHLEHICPCDSMAASAAGLSHAYSYTPARWAQGGCTARGEEEARASSFDASFNDASGPARPSCAHDGSI
jgi:hypothetical protein